MKNENKEQCLFSIVIPVFNGTNVITTCLDSIYSQGLDTRKFEVICVDDCSTDPMCLKSMESYEFHESRPENLFILKHEVNRKQGAARNTGVCQAKGKWILYIDCDDYFVEGCLKKLSAVYENNEALDLLIYNYSTSKTERCINDLSSNEMTGREFFQTQPIPWAACSYTYKRDFLLENHIEYAEEVFYEDTDYVMKAVLCAKRMKFVDLPIFFYNVYDGQTSKLNSPRKVEDIFKLSSRLKQMGIERAEVDPKSSEMIINHHLYLYNMMLKRYLWRLPLKNISDLLRRYEPWQRSNLQLSFIISQCPYIYAIVAVLAKPILLMAEKILKK